MDFNPIILSIPIFFLLIGVEMLVDIFRQKTNYRFADAIANISCGIVDQVAHIFFKVCSVGIYATAYHYLRLSEIPRTWYTWILLFVAADFCYYWAHRMSHQINLFWAGHVVHHQSEDYNLSVALRQGAFQILFTSFFYIPLAIAGFDTYYFLSVSAFVTLYQFWIHTEHIGKMGWFEKVFNTPSHHRVHHGRNPEYIDKNHAGVFIIWDKLFGTFKEETEKPQYGITLPLRSFSAIKAHTEPFRQLIFSLRQTPKTGDRIKILLMPPGWKKGNSVGPQAEQIQPTETAKKYDLVLGNWMRSYALLQFSLTLLVATLLLFTHSDLHITITLSVASFILLSMAQQTALLENNASAWKAEWIRVPVVPMVLAALTGLPDLTPMVIVPVFLIIVTSYSLLIKIKPALYEDQKRNA